MTDGGQSRKEASTLTTDLLLSPKQTMRVGSWNVQTMYQTGKQAQVIKEMNRYKLDLLGIAETRWTKSGKQNLSSGDTIIWSGREDDYHYEGVALVIGKKHKKSLLEWKPINERLLYVRLNGKHVKLSIIVAYAPTERAQDEDKDHFYELLQRTLDMIPKHDTLLLIGDLNAKIGSNNEGRKRTMGKHGMGEINNNGTRLVNICEENDLVIGGTLFPHKDIHKYTWTSPDGNTRNQIDHIIINGKWRHSLLDVRTMRNADIGSDHNLLLGKLTLKLRKAKIGEKRNQRFDVNKLKDPEVKKQFNIALKNRFTIIENETAMDIHNFNTAMCEAAEETIGFRKSTKSPWLSQETWKIIEERRLMKKKLLDAKSPRLSERAREDYRRKDKEVKRSARNDKRDYVERLASEAETAAGMKDMKTVYSITKKLRGDRTISKEMPTKAEDGTQIVEEVAKMNRWKDHFQKILNRPDPTALSDIAAAEEDMDINLEPITLQEVKEAIHKLKNGKAPGEDRVCAEMLKSENEETPRILLTILNKIWEDEIVPEEWRKGIIVKLPKKGDLGICGNWRGITLLSLTSKVFSRIILQRISTAVDSKIRQEQAGFRKGRSCIDHIFALRQIIEQSQEWNSTLYVVFVDFEKAFDSVHRNSLWKILRHYGVPQKIVNIIQSLYTNFECRVIHNNELTEPFAVNTGVKQGCILSPLLFSLCIDWIMRNITKEVKRGIQWTMTTSLEDLEYADDIGLLASRYIDIQGKTTDLNNLAGTIGLKINEKKTQVMRTNTQNEESILVNNKAIEDVDDFTYLGSKLTKDGDCAAEINTRISKANQAFAMLWKIWRSTALRTSTKIKIFKSNVLSVLLYGSECWKTTDGIAKKLDTFQNKCLRRILKIFWPNTISNEQLMYRSQMVMISEVIGERRWRWLGHVCRMHQASIPKIALRWTAQGKRGRGRPKETWRRTVEKDLKRRGLTLTTAPATARDRAKWKSLAAASSAHGS